MTALIAARRQAHRSRARCRAGRWGYPGLGFASMRPRSGSARPKTRKRCLQVACTNLLTNYFLSDRSPATFKAFVFPDLTGVVVHDRGLGAVPDDA